MSSQWCGQVAHLSNYEPKSDKQHENLPWSLDTPVDYYALDYSFVADPAQQIWCTCYDHILQNREASYREH